MSDDSVGFMEENIKSQHIGKLFDDFMDRKHKITFKKRMKWRWRDIKGMWHSLRYRRRNRHVWRKTLSEIRPWEGFHGLLTVMQTHLHDYIETEE